jgi:hypothetical protein
VLQSLDAHGELIVRRVKPFDRRHRVDQKEQSIELTKIRSHPRAMRNGLLKICGLLSRHQSFCAKAKKKSSARPAELLHDIYVVI